MNLRSISKALYLSLVSFFLITAGKAFAMDISFNETQQDDMLTIAPTAQCDCQQTFLYKLTSKKSSQAGSSTSTQSGRFETTPNQLKTLSKLSFNLTDDTSYTMQLTISDIDGKTVASEKLSFP